MRPTHVVILTLLALAGCNSTTPNLEPLPGSLTYGETGPTRKTIAAPGTMIQNRFRHEGAMVSESYEVQPDHTYKLVRREVVDTWPPN